MATEGNFNFVGFQKQSGLFGFDFVSYSEVNTDCANDNCYNYFLFFLPILGEEPNCTWKKSWFQQQLDEEFLLTVQSCANA